MRLHPRPLLLAAAAVLFVVSRLPAADKEAAAEARLRENLRSMLLQLRTAEGEKATLQAAQAASEQKVKSLEEALTAANKQAETDRENQRRQIAELQAKGATRESELSRLHETVRRWQTSHAKLEETARTTESARAQLEQKAIGLERRVADQQRRNQEMYTLGKEILTRYEKFGLGTAVLAREPFTGIARVKFENLIQQYDDGLTDRRIQP